jgi:hypothetical protein
MNTWTRMSNEYVDINIEARGHLATCFTVYDEKNAIVNINGFMVIRDSEQIVRFVYPPVKMYGRDDMRPMFHAVEWKK